MTKRMMGGIALSEDAYLRGKFVCPNCGDMKFGSMTPAGGSLVRARYGHADDGTVCTFRWPEGDDHKYFHLPLELVRRALW
jgi:hypothetical protein